MKKKLILLLALMMVSSMFLVACGGDDQEVSDDTSSVDTSEDVESEDSSEASGPLGIDPNAKPGGTLRFGADETDGLFSPPYYASSYDYNVVSLVFNSLLTRDFDGNWVPDVAKELPTLEEDGRILIYELREDVKFSDGTPLTAHDVVFTYQVMADPSYIGRMGSVVENLEGYQAYRDGEDENALGVEALDDYTVKFTFEEALRTNISNSNMGIMSKAYYSEGTSYGDVHDHIYPMSAQPMGAGPYFVDQYRPSQDIILTRNEHYFHDDQYLIEEIEYIFTTSDTQMDDLEAGIIDLVDRQIDADDIERAFDIPGLNINEYPRNSYGYVAFNHQNSPTDELAVRQALFYSMNFDEFIQGHFRGYAEAQYHPFTPAMFNIDDEYLETLPDYDYDIEKAKSLLDEAGWEVGDSGYRERDGEVLELRFLALAVDNHPLDSLIPMWERDWGNALNIRLRIAYEDFNSMMSTVQYDADNNVDQWNMFFMARNFSSDDPHAAVTLFESHRIGNNENNTLRYSNPTIDQLVPEAERAMTIEEASPLYQEIGRILVEDAALLPMYVNTVHDFYYEYLMNFETDTNYPWYMALRYAWLDK